jgi:4-hydroxybutyryl-CoA dehydratase/vinylacetyl-CoA-Delta-isomerase
MCGEWKQAFLIAHNIGLLHRRTGCAYRIPLSEILWAWPCIAEYNGVADVPHIREKLTEAAMYLQTLKSLTRAAVLISLCTGACQFPIP